MEPGRIEFELKFIGAPADVAALPESRFFAAVAPVGGTWERLSSTYYDTNDGALAGERVSLRLREEGAALIQAVKVKSANAASRLEYEVSLERVSDFPAAVGDEEIDSLILGAKPQLLPLANTTVDRWAAIIRYKETEIELAVDLGQASALDGEGRRYSGPLAEVELELISGDQAAVFDFARLLLANSRLRVSTVTKLEAALAQLPDADPIGKRINTPLDPEMMAADAFAAALSSCAARLASLQGAIIDLRRPEGIHQMRVALRRLRAIERIHRRYLLSSGIETLAARAKGFAGVLGEARDWDVFLGETLPAAQQAGYATEGLRPLKANAEAARAAAWSRATGAVASEAFTAFLLDLMEASSLARWRQAMKPKLAMPVRDFAPAVLDRALRKTIRTANETLSDADLAARHPLRIALKKLRYPVQLYKGLYPKERRKPYMVALSALQDAFGAVNDAVVAQGLAERAAAEGGESAMRAAGFISGYKAAEAGEAVKKIDAAWDAFEKMTPFWKDQQD